MYCYYSLKLVGKTFAKSWRKVLLQFCVKVDENVVAYQVDNKFLAVRTVDNSGELSIDFLSMQLPTTCSSKGMLETVKNGDENGFDLRQKLPNI